MKDDLASKRYGVKCYIGAVVLLWTGFLFAWLNRYPNPLSVLIFDHWIIILPFVSVMIPIFGYCRKRKIKISLIYICVLFAIAVLNFSM